MSELTTISWQTVRKSMSTGGQFVRLSIKEDVIYSTVTSDAQPTFGHSTDSVPVRRTVLAVCKLRVTGDTLSDN